MAAQTAAELILLIEEDREILELLKSNPDVSCMSWNIRPEGRYGLISSGLPGLTPSEKWNNHFGFSFFPVGRAKFLFQRSLDAARPSAKITSLTTLRWSVCSSVSGMLFPPPSA